MTFDNPAYPSGPAGIDWTRSAPTPTPTPPANHTPEAGSGPSGRGRRVGGAAALILAGALIGGFGATALEGSSSSAATGTSQAGAAAPGGNTSSGALGRGGPGGAMGTPGTVGSVGSVGADTVTVTTTSGSTTYAVTGATEIQANGATAQLSALTTGERVLVEPGTTTSNGHTVAARILAGDPPAGAGAPGGTSGT